MNNLLILGSGRSGTSMVAGSFSNSGYFLGDQINYLGENKANPKGYFEDYEVNTVNEDILNENLFNIPESLRKALFPSKTYYRARWLARIPISKKIVSTAQINNRIESLIKKPAFCYKDPRFCYTLPVWKAIMQKHNIDVKYLVVYREPNKTSNSIVRECNENKALHPLKMNTKIALKVWLLMYSHILENYKNDNQKDRWKFVHFNQLFFFDKLKEIESFTQSSIDTSFPDMQLSRSNSELFQKNIKVLEIYNSLNKLSGYQ